MKLCTKCKAEKSEEEFRLRKRGLNSSCRSCDAKYSRLYRLKNPGKVSAYNKKYFSEINPDYRANMSPEAKEIQKQKACLLKRKESFKERRRATRSKYREKEKAHTTERRKRLRAVYASEKQAIKALYNNCPENMVVDHILPLFGKTISGLHVLANLQYLTNQENSLKSWAFDGTNDNVSWRKTKESRIGQ